MVSSNAQTVNQYLAELPEERRKAIFAVRRVIRKNLPKGFEERMEWGMICYQLPLKRYRETYNQRPLCLAALASQKGHMAVYLMSVYGDPETERWFTEQYKTSGKKMDMGKSCIRFKRVEDLPLELIGETILKENMNESIARYENSRHKTTTKGKKR